MKYPFNKLVTVGDAFDVAMSEVSEASLRSYVGKKSAALAGTGVRYCVRKFADEGVYEVSLVQAEIVETSAIRKARPVGGRDLRAELDAIVGQLRKS